MRSWSRRRSASRTTCSRRSLRSPAQLVAWARAQLAAGRTPVRGRRHGARRPRGRRAARRRRRSRSPDRARCAMPRARLANLDDAAASSRARQGAPRRARRASRAIAPRCRANVGRRALVSGARARRPRRVRRRGVRVAVRGRARRSCSRGSSRPRAQGDLRHRCVRRDDRRGARHARARARPAAPDDAVRWARRRDPRSSSPIAATAAGGGGCRCSR